MIHWPVDVELLDHERILDVSDDPEDRLAALGAFVALGLWCQSKMSDGRISKRTAHALMGGLGPNSPALAACIRTGLVVDHGDHYEVRNFTRKTKPREERLAAVDAKQKRQRAWVSTRRQNVDTSACRRVDTGSHSLSGSLRSDHQEDPVLEGGGSREGVTGIRPIPPPDLPPANEVPPTADDLAERELPLDAPIPPEWAEFAHMQALTDVELVWVKFKGHYAGRRFDGARWRGLWHKWVANELPRQRTERERRREHQDNVAGPARPASTGEEISARAQAIADAKWREQEQRRKAREAQKREQGPPLPLAGGKRQ